MYIDFAGHFQGQNTVTAVDSSKWLEAVPVTPITSQAMVRALRKINPHGIPDTSVSDNAAHFTPAECKDLIDRNLIYHVMSACFHPSTNGRAEGMVRMTKEARTLLGSGGLLLALWTFR